MKCYKIYLLAESKKPGASKRIEKTGKLPKKRTVKKKMFYINGVLFMFYIKFIVIFLIAMSGFSGCEGFGSIESKSSSYNSNYSNNYSYNNYNENYNYNYNYNFEYGFIIDRSRRYVIGMAMADTDSPYHSSLISYAKEEADKHNIELLIADGKWDVQTQTDQIGDFIKQRVDAVILLPVDSKSMAAAARTIKEANIPLVNLNNRLDDIVSDLVDSYVGVNSTEQAELAAELMIEALGKKGGNVAVIEGMPNNDAVSSRTKGFVEKISQVNNIEVIAIKSSITDNKKACYVIRELLNEFPQINGIYAHDDNMVIDCINAAKELNKAAVIKFVGGGGSKDAYGFIKKGELYGTVAQSPGWEGIQAIKCAVDILHGKKVKVWYRDPLFKVTKENVENFKGLW